MIPYKISRFTIALPGGSDPANLAIYHTMSGAFFLIPTEQWERIQKNGMADDPEAVAMLMDQGILVDPDMDETVLFHQWRDRHVHDFSSIRSKNIVTRNCNNQCTYCIVDSEARAMSAQTVHAVDNFYLEQIDRRNPKQVRDDYLGGEPLLNLDLIAQSAGRRSYFCRGKGVDYGFTITSNGTLLTREIVERIKSVGLIGIRVSMAGPEAIHDVLRPSKTGDGTYAVILKNLVDIAGSVEIQIECQYDAGSDEYLRMPEMLVDFNRLGIPVAEINFTPILAKRGSDHFCTGMGDVNAYLYLVRQAGEHGIPVHTDPPSNACMADFRSIFVFDTDGSLLPCPSLQSGEMVYGTAENGIDFAADAGVLYRRLPEKCLQTCELLPLCMGGCRLQALTHNGNFRGIDCHYEIYRQLLDHFIRERVQTAFAEEKVAA